MPGRETHGRDGVMGSPTLRLARLALYLVWTFGLMPVQAVGLALDRSWSRGLPRFYHRWCCRILGFRVRTIGLPTRRRPALFVANHVSYTDITVLGSLIAGSFIAKAEVAGWPLFGWLAKLQRTVFVDRRVRSTPTQRDSITSRLAAGDALILFPEGTSSDGNRVLPFKSALFGAVENIPQSESVAVQPVSIAYTRLDGIPLGRLLRPYFAWYGTTELTPHLWSMLGLGAVEIVVEFHPPTVLADCGSRKALAGYCYARIAGGVAAALAGRPQPLPQPPAPASAITGIAAN
jgi:lyso-ornithine lipid O-acyltransferase